MAPARCSHGELAQSVANKPVTPCCTGMPECMAWPRAEWDESAATPDQRRTAAALAQHWLAPFASSGIAKSQLTASSASSRLAEERLCPLIQVLGNRIYVVAAPGMRQLDMQLHRCDSGPIDGDHNENYCHEALFGGPGTCRRQPRNWERHRLQVVLRMLHIATQRSKLPDFELRVCVDDTCHGVWEKSRRPRPIFTMASCLDSPTIPMIQWNAGAADRDPDLAVWDEVLHQRAAQAKDLLQPGAWACRQSVAVFRGSANQLHTYNNEWTYTHRVRRARTTSQNFNSSGRWALVEQRMRSPHLLNVRLSVLRRGDSIFGEHRDPELFKRRVSAVSSDLPASLSLDEQSSKFKYILHVEGHGGWADRLKHLLLLGSVVIKQDAGVREWFEPLLTPGLNYLAVQGDLANLSAVVDDARRLDKKSRSTAVRAVSWAETVLATPAIIEYAVALFIGYARLVRYEPRPHEHGVRYRCWPAVINTSHTECRNHALQGRQLTDCGFVSEPSTGSWQHETLRRGGQPAMHIFATLRGAMNASRGRAARKDRRRGSPCLVPGRL